MQDGAELPVSCRRSTGRRSTQEKSGGYDWVGFRSGDLAVVGGGWVVVQFFTDEELEGLRRFPEIGQEELFRFFTLTPADVAFVDPGRGRGP